MNSAYEAPSSDGHPLADLDALAIRYAERLAESGPDERDRFREDLVHQCLPFAARLARRYKGRGEPIEDLEQVARLGLLNAIDRYDPSRGSFTAFTVITVSGELKRHFRDRTWGVHVPRRLQDLSLELGQASAVLTSQLARRPTVAELAAYLKTSESAIREAQESAAGYTPASLNTPVGGDGTVELGDLFGDPDEDLESVPDKITVSRLLLRLPARERRMVAMRFYGNHSQSEIAAELGISQMHVSRLLSRALTWLREAMLSDVPPRWEGAGNHDVLGMHLSVDRSPDGWTVHVRGEIDRDTADRLRLGLRHAVATADGGRVVVDLSGVPLIDAAGIAVLLDASAAAALAEVSLGLSGAQPYVRHVLAVSGLATLLDGRP